MTRKTLLLIVILVVTAALAGTLWLVRGVDQNERARDRALSSRSTIDRNGTLSFLPAEALAMVRISGLGRGLELLEESSLGQRLARMDLPGIMLAAGAAQEDIFRVRQLVESGEWRIWRELFKALFGQETVIGLLPGNGRGVRGTLPVMPVIPKGLVVISRPGQGAGLLSLLPSFIPGLEQKQVSSFQGRTIREMALDQGLSLYHCSSEEYLLLALDPGSLVRLLKVRAGTVRSLVADDDFRQEQSRISGDLALAYLNSGGLSSLLERLRGRTERDQSLGTGLLSAVRSAVVGLSRAGDGLVEHKGSLALCPEALTPAQRRGLSSGPADPEPFLALAPEGTNLVIWQGGFAPAVLWPETGSWGPELEQLFGGGRERLTAISEGQAGILVRDLLTAGMFAVPECAVVVRTEDDLLSPMIRSVLRRIESSTGLALSVSRVRDQGLELHQISMPLGGRLQPSWSRVGEYEVLTTNQVFLHDIWEARSRGQGLLDQSGFDRVGSPLVGPGNGFQFMRLKACLEMVRTMLSQVALATRLRGDEAARFRLVMTELIDPLLQELQAFQAFATRISMSPEGLSFQGLLSTVRLEPDLEKGSGP